MFKERGESGISILGHAPPVHYVQSYSRRSTSFEIPWKMKSSTTVLSHNLSITTSPANHGPGDDSQCFHLPDAKFDVFHQRTETNLVTGVLNAVLSP